MLKGIPKILPPELLKILAEMGHTDELTIGDGNFPGYACGKDVLTMLDDVKKTPGSVSR